MVETASHMIPLGTLAPDFNLLDVISHQKVSLKSAEPRRATVIMFISNHCPFVQHLEAGLIQLANDYQPKGVRFIAISANDAVQYPEDGPDKMKERAVAQHYPFPYLYDESQSVAKAYNAACTPDFYIFDQDLSCVYRGQFDDSRPGNTIPVTGNDLRAALDALLLGRKLDDHQKPSIGCNIKWKQ